MCLRRLPQQQAAVLLLALALTYFQLVGAQPGVPASSAGGAKTVHVALKAKWQGTPLLLEAGEFVSDASKDQYWHFISSWHQHVSNLSTNEESSDAACVAAIADIAERMLTPRLRQVLPVALVLRSYSPRVTTFRRLAERSLHAAHKEYVSSGGGESAGRQPAYHELVVVPQAPCCWVDVDGQIAMTAAALSDQLVMIQRGKASAGNAELYEFDHMYPSSTEANHTALLYATPGSRCFDELHKLLVAAAEEGVVNYVHRPVYLANCNGAKHNAHCGSAGTAGVLQLGGYGAELAIKNMEYKAIDDSNAKKDAVALQLSDSQDADVDIRGFLFKKLLERKPNKAAELLTFRDILMSSADTDDTLKVWDLKDLGVQAAQRIVAASDPLKLLRDISHNFPSLVSSLSRLQANSTLKAEITANQNYMQAGASYLSINGFSADIQTLDPFILFKLIREEIAISDQLAALKLSPETIRQLLRLSESKEAGASIRIDARSPVHMHFVNDLEKDAQYQMFSPSLREMLMPVYPGQMRYVRKNLFHGVFVIDPVSPLGLEVIRAIKLYIDKLVPVRMGIMLAPLSVVSALPAGTNVVFESAAGHQVESVVSRMFYFFRLRSSTAAFRFLFKLAELAEDKNAMSGDSVSVDQAVAAFKTTYRKLKAKSQTETMDEAIEAVLSEARHADDVAASVQFIAARGLTNVAPCLLLNGMLYTNDNVPQMLLYAVNEETPFVQESIYYGQIDSSTDVLDFALKTGSYKRYNPLVLPQRGNAQPPQVQLAEAYADRSSAVAQLPYLHQPGTEDEVKPITHWLVADVSTPGGIQLAQEAIKRLANGNCKLARIAFLHNPADWQPSQPLSPAIRFVAAALRMTSRRHKLVPFLQSLLSRLPQLESSELLDLAAKVGLQTEQLRSLVEDQQLQKQLTAEVQSHQKLSQQLLHLQPGQNAVVTNGRVFTPISAGSFLAEDFELLDGVEYSTRASYVQPVVEKSSFDDVDADLLTSEFFSNLIAASVSITMGRARGQLEPKAFNKLAIKHSAIMVKSSTAVVDVRAVINPLSPIAQKLAPILIFLREAYGDLLALAIHLNPEVALSDIPLKSYYRYALNSQLTYTEQGSLASGPAAVFSNLATNKVLTLHMHVPEHWLVEGTYAQYDMDNLRLMDMGDAKSTYVQYELEALLVTGSCRDVSSREPPRGLQLWLGTDAEQHMVDTIVMSNLGYFQLKAAPGVWYLRLAPGRSSNIYAILASQDSSVDSQDVVEEWTVSVIDFGGRLVPLYVTKRPGQEAEDVLDTSESASDNRQSQVAAAPAGSPAKSRNLWEYAQHYLHGLLGLAHVPSHEAAATAEPDGIHIFSVASGHLYERFLKIMILSVLNNTKSPVTFWFIKNYLSPRFKDFIPQMARQYNFRYRLVTYKWPTWLIKQTEKQRIIWGYKILFLDVLFPLSLNKVIYVDADQIVRTDMQDLWDMDLHGAPLAYTPFCDNNKEMEGFRFWKQGFWKDHLRGRPYHISALYVVDLQRFRQTAAGDHLRVYYNNLAKDPNSLANLDQDLPNYAQHVVPIFSLPQEWLWCESWCGNATKAAAKTIDLCNNPMTKEPKLEGARRIVAEWPALDEEVRRFTEAVEAQGELAEGSDIAQPPLSASVGGNDSDDQSDRTEL